MDLDGKVEEPTKQTISLLGTRSQASYRKSQSTVVAAQDKDTLTLGDNHETQGASAKRFRGENGQVSQTITLSSGLGQAEVFKCTFGNCTKEFKSSQYLKTHLAYH